MLNEPLPIEGVLSELGDALDVGGVALLRAPPGAGKTTRVPLALLDAAWLGGKRIVLLEPRRLAARAAATRMARLLGSAVGHTVGYRMRLDTRVSAATRIEVVTEGVLTRMLQHDPSLDGIGLVIFDEFHERSVHADLGLALTLQARTVMRPDLRILVMSATLDAGPVASLLGGAPVITSEGRAWPVITHWLDQPLQGHVDTATARMALHAADVCEGDILVFLPGAAEIRRAESIIRSSVSADVDVYPLHGQLPLPLQDRAIAPSPPGRRKIVLATSIAETSLTIEGVRVVIDSGVMRVPRFSARTGMSRLETVRVTRSSADQRRGRAGRTAPGICYRMWTQPEDAGLVPHRTPEILETDLAPVALELASWGVRDPVDLAWLDPPPAAAYAQACDLLAALNAIDDARAITPHGRAIADFGLHPRLAHMLFRAAPLGLTDVACDIAALLSERDVFRAEHTRNPDLRLRLDALRSTRDARADAGAVDRVRREAEHWMARVDRVLRVLPRHGRTDTTRSDAAGLLLAFAYPDRIAQRRTGSARYILRNGRGAFADEAASISTSEFIVIASLDDAGREARIQLAAPLDRAEIEEHFADGILTTTFVEWDDATESVRAVRTRALGAVILDQARFAATEDDNAASFLIAAVRRKGIASLPWPPDAIALRRRTLFVRQLRPDIWPDLSDDHLLSTLEKWLLPFASHARRWSDLTPDVLSSALRAIMTWEQLRDLDDFAPTHIGVPTGSRIAVDYSDPSAPTISVRLQEMFGLSDTPRIAEGAVPVVLHLLSPAGRPVQVTSDLKGFWAGSYAEVRKEMRGRYPKHDWPIDPVHAAPSRRPPRRRPEA